MAVVPEKTREQQQHRDDDLNEREGYLDNPAAVPNYSQTTHEIKINQSFSTELKASPVGNGKSADDERGKNRIRKYQYPISVIL